MGPDEEKIDRLSHRLQQIEAKLKPDTELASASRYGWEFGGIVLGCGALGGLLDYAFGTSPWFLLAMVMVGFASGVLQAWRAIKKTDGDKTD